MSLSTVDSPFASLGNILSSAQWHGDDRMRSDSASRIDGIWAWPGYATTESLRMLSPLPVLRTLVEPVLAEYFTPRRETVAASLEREKRRVGWDRMLHRGRAVAILRRREGGYFVFVLGASDSSGLLAIRTRYVHLATGHAGPRLAEDVAAWRSFHPESEQVVNAYESHDHVYEAAHRQGGVFVVRGGGMTSMTVVNRLLKAAPEGGPPLKVLHVVRPNEAGHRNARVRQADHGCIAFQPFNFPKGANGGVIQAELSALSPIERAARLQFLGAPSVPRRRNWMRTRDLAAAKGRYALIPGEAVLFAHLPARPGAPGERERLCFSLATRDRKSPDMHHDVGQDVQQDLEADWLVDCIGLRSRALDHPLVSQMASVGLLVENPSGGIHVESDFEAPSARSGDGRLFVSGVLALGSEVAAVDSFFGLEYAALRIADRLADEGFCRRLGAFSSLRGWSRKLLGVAP
jgi:hypothetical protein